MGDEEYTSSPNDKLSFSKDSIRFDTIISGFPTKTYSFSVYNHSTKAIRIPQISLKNGKDSPFHVNADGTALSDGIATDFEIAGKDSMIVYLMANVPDKDSDTPTNYADELQFTTESGLLQSVILSASGQDVITLKNHHISESTTLGAKRPYRVMDSLVVDKGATLTLAAGTQFLFHFGAKLRVYGTLRIEGTIDAPVVLRGDRLDYMFVNQPYDRTPGLWKGIDIMSQSHDNYINYADIHSGEYGVKVDSVGDVTQRILTIENSKIHTVSNHAVDVRMANVFIGNSLLANAGGDCLHVRGGDVVLLQCTLARFYVFTGGYGHAIDFANFDGNARLPLHRLQLDNCIVTGYQDDEMMGGSNEDFKDDEFNYLFNYCLMNTPEPKKPDDHFQNCLWDVAENGDNKDEAVIKEKNFAKEFNLDYIDFSFELSPHSKAVGTANAELSEAYPNDIAGHERGNKPDMGCYQHQNEDKKE